MITNYETTRLGGATLVTVTSDLTGTVFFHWYLDGTHVDATTSPSRMFWQAGGDQVRVEVVDTLDPDFDYIAGAPAGWPARRTLWWVSAARTGLAAMSLDELALLSLDELATSPLSSDDVAHYRIDQQRQAEGYEAMAIVHYVPGRWTYSHLTGRLDDLTEYTWRIVPVDQAGNDGAAFQIGPETIVRRPDSPDFTATLDEPSGKITFAEAS